MLWTIVSKACCSAHVQITIPSNVLEDARFAVYEVGERRL